MHHRNEIRDFLTSRRAKITPDQAGLPVYGGNRRVPGLRREEVALLAGVSIDYYTRLERGNLNGVSQGVLDALANALQLDEAERAHLFDLARAASTTTAIRRRPAQQRVRPAVQRILDAMTGAPAFVRNGRRDILAANRLGYALYSELYVDPARPANVARFVFLNPRARAFFLDWESAASDTVAILRIEAGRNQYDRGLSDLVGELSTRSEEFRTRWAAHNVRFHRTGRKDIHHPVVGDLHLTFEVMDFSADPGLSLVVYSAEPGSASEDALNLLASLGGNAGSARPAGNNPRGRPSVTHAESASVGIKHRGEKVEIKPKQPSTKGPAELFTGDVWYDVIAQGESPSRLRVNIVRFAPGARTAWHRHANGQILHVTDGRGLVQSRGAEVSEIRAGDTVYTPPVNGIGTVPLQTTL